MEEIDEEKMKEQLEEEMARYEEDGYFKRLFKMFAGLGKPRSSGEYKEAVIELQRQVAPLAAILLPLIAVVVLFVVTAVGNTRREAIKVDIVQATEEDTKLDDIEPPPEMDQPPDVDVDVQVDAPSMNTDVSDPTPAPTAEPQSVKVADVDAMLNVKSPVMLKNVAGTARNAGVRGTYTSGGKGYGDAATEAAVYKALRWLKATQNPDGSWGTSPKYGLTKGMDKAAGAGFAILTFLAHGETPASPEFGDTVKKAQELAQSIGAALNSGSQTKLLAAVAPFEKDYDLLPLALEQLELMLRDALVVKAGGAKILSGADGTVKALAGLYADQALLSMVEAVEDISSAITLHANKNLTLSRLVSRLSACEQ